MKLITSNGRRQFTEANENLLSKTFKTVTMKKQLFYLATGIIACLISFNTALAQGVTFRELPLVRISASSTIVPVNAKINKAFDHTFKDASNLRWYEIDKNFLVKFDMNDRENRALFSRKGALVYHITYGEESFLPAGVRHMVRSSYYDQRITRVLRVMQEKRLIWIIHLEDARECILARVEDGEIEETKRLLKK
jgi:hypothetical protein